eukprot:4587619-Amphidinium_carterae.1
MRESSNCHQNAQRRKMLESQTVKTLGLANSATASARITPIVNFMEHMAKDEVDHPFLTR